jgi:hypothetical protein
MVAVSVAAVSVAASAVTVHRRHYSMSETPVLVPIFPYAAEGGDSSSSYFRQGNVGPALPGTLRKLDKA